MISLDKDYYCKFLLQTVGDRNGKALLLINENKQINLRNISKLESSCKHKKCLEQNVWFYYCCYSWQCCCYLSEDILIYYMKCMSVKHV